MANIKVHSKVPRTYYTLLERDSEFHPFILAYMYDEYDGTWAQGHYFSKLPQIEEYLNRYSEDYLCGTYKFVVKVDVVTGRYEVKAIKEEM